MPNETTETPSTEAIVAETLDPTLSPDFVELGLANKARIPVLAAELAELEGAPERNDQAVAAKRTELDQARAGYKRLQVRILNLKAERKITKLVAPHMGLLADLKGTDLDAMGALLGELADVLPECVAAAFEAQGVTVDWLDEHSNARELLDAAKAQIAKLGLGDLLGNVSGLSGLKK